MWRTLAVLATTPPLEPALVAQWHGVAMARNGTADSEAVTDVMIAEGWQENKLCGWARGQTATVRKVINRLDAASLNRPRADLEQKAFSSRE
jgi:hypothetical protein